MASYRGHLTFSTGLGIAYGGLAAWKLGVPLSVAGVGGLFTALGGLLPDLDSDSGVPVRELFGLAGAAVPLLMLRRMAKSGLSPEETLLARRGGLRAHPLRFFQHFQTHDRPSRHVSQHPGHADRRVARFSRLSPSGLRSARLPGRRRHGRIPVAPGSG